MNKNDSIVTQTITLSYSYILLLGFYIIVNGHKTPGGGFQGGAVLAAIFIIRYLINPVQDIKLEVIQLIEKILFLCIALFPILFIFYSNIPKTYGLNKFYLIIMNSLIGIKVCCGLTIVFYRFVFYESR